MGSLPNVTKTIPPPYLLGDVAHQVPAQEPSQQEETLDLVDVPSLPAVELELLGDRLGTGLDDSIIARSSLAGDVFGTGVEDVGQGDPAGERRRPKEVCHGVDHEGERDPLYG